MHVTYDHTQPSKQAKPHGIHICIHKYCQGVKIMHNSLPINSHNGFGKSLWNGCGHYELFDAPMSVIWVPQT